MKYLPLVWAAFRRHSTESLLTFLVLTIAFTLFSSMVALRASYDKAIDAQRMDRLLVTNRFCCTNLGIGRRAELMRIPGVRGASGGCWRGARDDARGCAGLVHVPAGSRQRGAALGTFVAWLVFDGRVVYSGTVFTLRVSASLAALGLAWGVVIALLGGLFPAIRAGKLPAVKALRST